MLTQPGSPKMETKRATAVDGLTAHASRFAATSRFAAGDFVAELLQLRDDLRVFLEFRQNGEVPVDVGPVEGLCALTYENSADVVPVERRRIS